MFMSICHRFIMRLKLYPHLYSHQK